MLDTGCRFQKSRRPAVGRPRAARDQARGTARHGSRDGADILAGMLRYARHLAPLLFVVAITAAEADPVVAAIIAEGRQRSQVMDHLRHLCLTIGPRLTGSTNLEQAEIWAEERFKAFGLKARREEWGSVAVGYDRGAWSARMVVPRRQDLTIGFDSWTPSTGGPRRGPALLAPANADELERRRDALPGAWVVLPAKGPTGDFAKTLRATLHNSRIAGVIRAASGDLIVTGGRLPRSWEDQPRTVTVTMVAKDHAAILGLLTGGTPVELEIDIAATFRRGPIAQRNVIADIPGSDLADEVVIVGGHLDSWDGAQGATDNGTGVATTLEAARLLMAAKARPRRTIRFMLFTGEEQGLLGSQQWVRKHLAELPRISAVLVHDGGTNAIRGLLGTASMLPLLERAFAPVVGLDPAFPFSLRESRDQGLPAGIGSDHDSFLAVAVPGFFWVQQGKQDYTHEHHTQHDRFSAALEPDQRHSALVVAIGALGLANLDRLLPRDGLTVLPPRRMFGVQLEQGTTIADVVDDSPAAKAGLQPGDRITKVGDTVVSDSRSLNIARDQAPKSVAVTVIRDGMEVVVTVVFER